jgi:hypothetical protein
MNSLEQLPLLWTSLEANAFDPKIFYLENDPEILREGFEVFLNQLGLRNSDFQKFRSLIALGTAIYREQRKAEAHETSEADAEVPEDQIAQEDTIDKESPPTPEEVSEKFKRLFARTGSELRRSKKMTRLLNARVQWTFKEDQIRILEFRDGRPARTQDSLKNPSRTPWKNLQIADYDRMSVLLSGLAAHPHSVTPHSFGR